ncbi:MAG: endonuclease V, partial [Candidatus Omnitrophica bacterium]|nr:endonuclease V [Candidatus Omnitrophota bacterium]
LMGTQEELKRKIKLVYQGKKVRYIAGCDVAYVKNKAIACAVVLRIPELDVIETSFHIEETVFPYIPGFLAFREGPVIIVAIKKLTTAFDVIILDGHGIAHPRKMGLATYTGIFINMPTIGCAKSLFAGQYADCGNRKGDFSPIAINGEVVGVCLRTKRNVKPVFVSPGNLIDIENSVKIVLQCSQDYRLPEPLRLAHIFANNIKRTLQGGKNE